MDGTAGLHIVPFSRHPSVTIPYSDRPTSPPPRRQPLWARGGAASHMAYPFLLHLYWVHGRARVLPLLVLALACATCSSTDINSGDTLTLSAVYSTTGGPFWIRQPSFTCNVNFTCDASQSVTYVRARWLWVAGQS